MWLEATSYCVDNFNEMAVFSLIKNTIVLFKNRNILNYLTYIKYNFGFITYSILKIKIALFLFNESWKTLKTPNLNLAKTKDSLLKNWQKLKKKYRTVYGI